MKTTLTILGSTGSVGRSTLDVVARHRRLYDVYALTAHNDVDTLAMQCRQFKPRYAVIANEARYAALRSALDGRVTRALSGTQALHDLAGAASAGVIVSGIVGVTGLRPLFRAVQAGKRVLFANKEPMVVAGALLRRECRKSGATLLPLDSEHNAIMQCFVGETQPVSMTLTVSGGPLLDLPVGELASVTPGQACAHPNWEMGAKISVDSATMMNKGLEVMEAVDLFEFQPRQVQVLIHPQSIVHGFAAYPDGSVIAQMAEPDMRVPIACALAWPRRVQSGVKPLDLAAIGRLDFSEVDEKRFRCFALARQALDGGPDARVLLNAANEVAVAAFLDGRLRFDLIPAVVEEVLSGGAASGGGDIDAILSLDGEGRRLAEESVRGCLAERGR